MKPTMSNNTPFVSVIIPVYNVEKYLLQCVRSVLTQTYDNYEVILIDDGSTDDSGKMCDDFARLDNRVHTFHKVNGGMSDARNFGLIQSKGEYVIFVDSDDYVSDEYVDYLVKMRELFDADIAVTKLAGHIGDDYIFDKSADKKQCMSTEDALIKMMYRVEFNVGPVGKIYRKNLLLAHPYPVGIFYEDLATTYKIIAACKKIAYGDKIVYCYRKREGSITQQSISEKHLYGIAVAKEELRYMEKHFPNAVDAAKYSVVHMIIGLVDNVFYETNNSLIYFYYLRNELKVYLLPVLRNRNVKMSRKVRCVAIMLGYYPTRILWKLIDLSHKLKKRNIKF